MPRRNAPGGTSRELPPHYGWLDENRKRHTEKILGGVRFRFCFYALTTSTTFQKVFEFVARDTKDEVGFRVFVSLNKNQKPFWLETRSVQEIERKRKIFFSRRETRILLEFHSLHIF
jgi:hypothetical protein